MKRFNRLALAITLGLSIGMCTIPAPVSAFGLGDIGTVVAAGQAYAQQTKALNYLDNQGRNQYFAQVEKTYGINNDPTANAMLDNIMGRLTTSIAAVDPSIKTKPYNYFVNNEKSFNAFCTLGHNLSVNIGAFNLGNALGAIAGASVLNLGLSYSAVSFTGAGLSAVALLLVVIQMKLAPQQDMTTQQCS